MKNRTKINVVVVIVVAIVLLSMKNCSCDRQKSATKSVISNNNYLLTNPPIPKLDLPYQKFEIDPSQPNVVCSKHGAKIAIPVNAFLDKDGNIIKGKVELSFREFYNPLDFYLAGIPMEFNDNGVEKVFESAGMVELIAKSNNNELFVNPSNKIKVDLYSWTKSKNFNLYNLDKNTGKWIEKGKDSISTSNIDKELNSLPPIPSEPKVATRASFTIVDETKRYPEIEAYKNVRFEPIDLNKCKISDAYEMNVKPLNNGIYEVTSIVNYGGLRKENKCNCYLAFEEGQDYNNALKIYQKKYGKLLKERKLFSDKVKFEWSKYFGAINAHKIAQFKALSIEEKIVRSLSINNFGFVNCDLPTSYPFGGEINPMYADESGKPISLSAVVLVEKNTNALFKYSSTIKYNPENDNILWGLTKDNQLAYLKNDDLRLFKSKSAKQKVQMHIHRGELNSYEDIMKVLF